MRADAAMLAGILLCGALMCGCNGGSATFGGGGNPPAAPTISASTDAQTGVQNGAVIVSCGRDVPAQSSTTPWMAPHPPHLRSSTRRRFWWRQASLSTRSPCLRECPARLRRRPSRPTFLRIRWSGATSSRPPGRPPSRIRQSGLTTPATAASVTANWKTIARGDRTPLHAAWRIPASSWERTTVIFILWLNNLRQACTPRHG